MLLPLIAVGCGRDAEDVLHRQVREYNLAVEDLNKIGTSKGTTQSDRAKAEALEERIQVMLDDIKRNPKFEKNYKLGRPSASFKGNVQFIEQAK